MNNVGIVKGNVCSTTAMPSPKDVRALSKYIDVFVQSNAGEECGYSDNEYALEGCIVRPDSESIIESADLLLFQNPITEPLQPTTKKVIVANIDFFNDKEQLSFFKHENIDLFTFEAINDEEERGVFKDKFVNFVRFHLGDPVQPEYISLFSSSKILSEGKVIHKKLL
ncbi:hypothetical protein [Brumimicrobium aurantiacum]|uniref:Alanine dehydrogenase/pyridine nucleotide transhydrogenase N-terminal domain-containing protein n=1 Tax=Brumimicrobium aurantiacum TaxID=1737063 RepID=A0A3E1EXL7_9FLAO|nr:hypothetical protein [Brumimicrobium aurantiacum]RFC54305.1 hypothetical protein DXU93_07705 [Brumimicrobium aurantiacum]